MFPTPLGDRGRYRAQVPLGRSAPDAARGRERPPCPDARFVGSIVRWFIAIATSISVLILGVAWAGTPVPVVDSPRALEQNPAGSQGYIAWAKAGRATTPIIREARWGTEDSPESPRDRSLARRDRWHHGRIRRVWEVWEGNGNLRMFDVLTETRSDPPAGVNTPRRVPAFDLGGLAPLHP